MGRKRTIPHHRRFKGSRDLMSDNTASKKRKIDVEYLTEKAERFLDEEYGTKLTIPIAINNRLRTTYGAYYTRAEDERPIRIEIAGHLLEYGTEDTVLDTLYHELIHHAVHLRGGDYADGSDDFESELRKHDVSSTETKVVGKWYLMTCRKCGNKTETRVRRQATNPEQYITGCCRSAYDVMGSVIYDGNKRKEVASI